MSRILNIQLDGQVLSEIQKTGIGWCVWRLTEQIVKRDDVNVTINYFSKGHSKEQIAQVYSFEKENVRVKEIKNIKSWMYKMHSLIIPIPYRKLFGKNADASCFLNYYVPPFAAGKRISIVYDMVAKAFPETMDTKTRIILGTTLKSSIRRADRIVTISQAAKSEIVKYFKVAPEKISVMPMGVEEEYFPKTDGLYSIKSEYGICGDYFFYLGTLEPRKNIETLLRAYHILRAGTENCPKLVISGKKGWGYDGIFALAKELGLEDDVIFTGYLKREEIPVLMTGAKAFVFPSVYEGFGMPPLEAMACGCPVIASNVSAMPEVIADAGILCDPKKPEEFALAMEKLLNDGEFSNTLRARGLERAKNYTWQNAADIFMDTVINSI
ncbi:MAG: glycosyltransferase family 4 protein [Christensenellaceae bacterium]|nr:glycosyltransferase family 4 protein [Christensenellaceae bacterium]